MNHTTSASKLRLLCTRRQYERPRAIATGLRGGVEGMEEAVVRPWWRPWWPGEEGEVMCGADLGKAVAQEMWGDVERRAPVLAWCGYDC